MDRREFVEFLNQCIGEEVISSTSGGGAGSLWLIEFKNDDNFYIFCDWRIEQNMRVLATCTDDNTARIGLLSRSVRLIEGKKLLSYELSKQYDLILYFEDLYCVRVFCSVSYSQTEDGGSYNTNWWYAVPELNMVIRINNFFQLIEGSYDS